jgi:TP901 family phage tail tape measure protein
MSDETSLDLNTKPLIQSVAAAEKSIDSLIATMKKVDKEIPLSAAKAVSGTRKEFGKLTESIGSSLQEIQSKMKIGGFSSLDELKKQIRGITDTGAEEARKMINLQREVSKQLNAVYAQRYGQLKSAGMRMSEQEIQLFKTLGATIVKADREWLQEQVRARKTAQNETQKNLEAAIKKQTSTLETERKRQASARAEEDAADKFRAKEDAKRSNQAYDRLQGSDATADSIKKRQMEAAWTSKANDALIEFQKNKMWEKKEEEEALARKRQINEETIGYNKYSRENLRTMNELNDARSAVLKGRETQMVVDRNLEEARAKFAAQQKEKDINFANRHASALRALQDKNQTDQAERLVAHLDKLRNISELGEREHFEVVKKYGSAAVEAAKSNAAQILQTQIAMARGRVSEADAASGVAPGDGQLNVDRRFLNAQSEYSADQIAKDVAFANRRHNALKALEDKNRTEKATSLNQFLKTVRAVTEKGLAEEVIAIKKYGKAAVEAAKAYEEIRLTDKIQAAKARASVEEAMNKPSGAFSDLKSRKVNPVIDPDAEKKVKGLSGALKGLTGDMNTAHSAARGLASGFGLLWLTWGEMLPILAGAAISYGITRTVKMGAEVQHTFETIRVLSLESAESVAHLNSQMLELARTGPFGPKEIADAMKTLSLAGLSAADVSASVKDVLNFAVAGTTSIEKAADVMTSVATAFNVVALNYNYVGDVISKTAAVSKSSVESIGEAFKTSSVLNKQYGVSLEDVGVGLAALSNLGIQGTAAGTALRNMYVELSGRTKEQAKLMKKYFGEMRDETTGSMKDIVTIVTQLNKGLSSIKTPIQQKDLLQKVFGERGSKPIIEFLELVNEKVGITFNKSGEAVDEFGNKVTDVAERVQSKLSEIQSSITNSEGFQTIAAAQLSLTSLKQMESVVASLKASLVDAFAELEPKIFALSLQLKNLINNPEFVSGLRTLVGAFLDLTKAVVENIEFIGKLALAFVGFKLFTGVAAAVSTVSVGVIALKKALEGAVTFGTRLLAWGAAIGRFAGPVGAVLGAIYLAYEAWMGSMEKAQKVKGEVVADPKATTYLEILEKERDRIIEHTEALRLNIDMQEMKTRREAAALKEQQKNQAQAAIFQANHNVTLAQMEVEKIEGEYKNSPTPTIFRLALGDKLHKEQVASAKQKVKELQDIAAQVKQNAEDTYLKIVSTEDQVRRAQANLNNRGKKPPRTPETGNVEYGGGEAEKAKNAALMNLRYLPPPLPDQTEEIAKQGAANLKAIVSHYEQENDAVQAAFKLRLVSANDFYDRIEDLTKRQEEAEILQIQQNILADNQATDKALQARLAQYMEFRNKTVPMLKGTEADKALIIKEADKQLEGYFNEQGARLAAKVETVEAAMTEIRRKGAKRRQDADIKTFEEMIKAVEEGHKKALQEFKQFVNDIEREANSALKTAEEARKQTRSFFDKLRSEEATAKSEADLLEPYKFVDSGSMIQLQAQKAAVMAQIEMNKKLVDEQTRVRNAIDDVTASYNKQYDEAVRFGGINQDGIVEDIELQKQLNKFLEARIKLQQTLAGIVAQTPVEVANAGKLASDKVVKDEIDKMTKDAADAIETALFEGGKAGSGKLRDLVVAELKKPIKLVIQALVNPIMGAITGALGLGGTANAAGAAASGAASGIAGGLLGGATALAGNFGSGIASGLTAWGAEGSVTGLLSQGSLLFEGGLSGAINGLGTVVGALGPIVVGVAALMALNKKGETRSGAEYETNGGVASKVSGPSGGALSQAEEKKLVESTYKSITDTLSTLGSKAVIGVFGGGLETSEKGRGGVYAGGSLNFADGTSTSFGQTRNQRVNKSMTADEAVQGFGLELKQVYLQAIQAAVDIPKSVSDLLKDLDIEGMAEDKLDTLITQIEDQTKAVKAFSEAVAITPFDSLKEKSYDLYAELIKVAGGFDALTGKLTTFYEGYFTDEEKRVQTLTNVQSLLKKNGVEATIEQIGSWTKDEVKAAVLALDPNVIGAAAYNAAVDSANLLLPLFTEEINDDIATFREKLYELPFDNISDMSDGAISNLAKVSGGLDSLSDSLQFIYDNYLSDDQKNQFAYRRVTEIASKYGIDMTVADAQKITRADIGAAFSTFSPEDIGSEAWNDLVKAARILEPTFVSLDKAMEDTKDSASALSDEMQKNLDDQKNLQQQLADLEGNRLDQLKAERAALAPGNLALYDRVTMLKLEQEYIQASLELQGAVNSAIDNLLSGIEAVQAAAEKASTYYNSVKDEFKAAGVAVLDGQYDAQQKLLTLQKQAYENLKQFSDSIGDYLDELNSTGASEPADKLKYAKDRFAEIADLAKSGDADAQNKLIESAKKYLEVSRNFSSSSEDYRRDEAKVRIALDNVQKSTKEAIEKLPEAATKTESLADQIKSAEAELKSFDEAVALMVPDLARFGITATRAKEGLGALTDSYFIAQAKMVEADAILKPIIQAVPTFFKSEAENIAEEFNKARDDFAKDLGLFLEDLETLPEDLKDVFTNPSTGVVKSFGDILNGEGGLTTKIKTVFQEFQEGKNTLGTTLITLQGVLTGYRTEVDNTLSDAVEKYKTASKNLTDYSREFGLTIGGYNGKLGEYLTGLNTAINASTTAANAVAAATIAAGNAATAAAAAANAIIANPPTVTVNVTVPQTNVTNVTNVIQNTDTGTGSGTGTTGTGTTVTPLPTTSEFLRNTVSAAIDSVNSGGSTELNALNQIISNANSYGYNSADVASALNSFGVTNYTAEDVRNYAAGIGIPAFARGTNMIPEDMVALLHQGEAVVPAEFNPERFNSGLGRDDDEVVATLEEVRNLLIEIRDADRAEHQTTAKISANIRRIREIEEGWDNSGIPPYTP